MSSGMDGCNHAIMQANDLDLGSHSNLEGKKELLHVTVKNSAPYGFFPFFFFATGRL